MPAAGKPLAAARCETLLDGFIPGLMAGGGETGNG